MAIDDNTVYGLTGAQVKELPGKIEAVKGKPKVLTADDYNYPTNNPSSVALWLLEAGVYIWGAGMRVYTTTTIYDSGYGGSAIVLKDRESATPFSYILSVNNAKDNFYCVSPAGIGIGSNGEILVSGSIIDNLTTSTPYRPLSANQGKVLNDKIGGDLSNLTTTDKTSLINAINEVASSGVSDVQIDGTSIVSGGVATIPLAASSSAGVIKVGTAVSTYMGSDSRLSATTRTYEDYTSGSAAMFIGKGTLENVITGKGLVSNTDYASNATGGVIRTSTSYGTTVSGSGVINTYTLSYENYNGAANTTFVGKGTLENVIEGKGLVDQTDLDTKQDVLTAGSNIQINGSTISATDTTYSDFTGTDGTTAGAAGLVPAPAATDAGKFLKADGTWGTAGSSVNVVQSTGLSTTDVMSQRATSLMVYKDPSSQNHIAIGNNANVGAVAGSYYTAVGSSSSATGASSLALGNSSIASGIYSVALSGSSATNRGEFAIGLRDPYGYNNSNYRLLTGLYDPQSDHDAATKGYVDSVTPTITLSTTDIGEGAALPANTLYGVYE